MRVSFRLLVVTAALVGLVAASSDDGHKVRTRKLDAEPGTCGGGNVGNNRCPDAGDCCSKRGYCGSDDHHCSHLVSDQSFLPSYLELLPETDPAFAALNETGVGPYILAPPGGGNLREFKIITFKEEHDVYRVYGGRAEQGKAVMCGFWWTLSPPGNIYPKNPLITAKSYERDIFAICPEWNDATQIIRCNIPAGYNTIVGIGQTADCDDGSTLIPSETDLQLNGQICNLISDPAVSCTFCSTDKSGLQLSTCVQIDDYDGYVTPTDSVSSLKKGGK